jgi:hypothetical protein
MLFLKILGALAALGIGLLWGRAGRYRQDPKEIDQALLGSRRSRRAKRHFTFINWLYRSERASHRRRRPQKSRFDLIDPKPPTKKD